MELLTKEQEKRVRENFQEYLNLYGRYYNSKTLAYIKESFLDENFQSNQIMDVMHQVYSATGVYDYIDNFYDHCIEEMAKTYNIDGNLLEVGCGLYPALAERIDKQQKEGTITVIDHDVFPISVGKIRIVKETFTRFTDIKGFSLVYGIMPCEATVPIIQNACENGIDFYINLCGCAHGVNSSRNPMLAIRIWFDYIDQLVSDLLPKSHKYEFYVPEWGSFPVIKSLHC